MGPLRPIAVADLNRDGAPDVVVGNADEPGSVFFNDGSGRNFSEVRWNDGEGRVYGIAVADLDGDGWEDLAVARSGARNGWLRNRP